MNLVRTIETVLRDLPAASDESRQQYVSLLTRLPLERFTYTLAAEQQVRQAQLLSSLALSTHRRGVRLTCTFVCVAQLVGRFVAYERRDKPVLVCSPLPILMDDDEVAPDTGVFSFIPSVPPGTNSDLPMDLTVILVCTDEPNDGVRIRAWWSKGETMGTRFVRVDVGGGPPRVEYVDDADEFVWGICT